MQDYNHKWDIIYQNFKRMFPLIEERVVTWWPSGRHEIILKLNDGDKIAYDDFRHCFWHVQSTKGNEEDEWRRYFSHKLGEHMRDSGIDGKELAERVGVSVQMISRYLNRKSTPSPFLIQKMARVLNVTCAELTEFPEIE